MLPNEDVFGNYVPALTAVEPATSPGSIGGVISTGSGAPTSTPSTAGAIYFDTDTDDQYAWYAGAWHPISVGGGSQEVFSGSGAPAVSPVSAQAFYIDTDNGDLWQWFGGVWS